jgi:hypothetical protein
MEQNDDAHVISLSIFIPLTSSVQVSTWIAQGAAVPMGAVGPMSFGSLATSSYAGAT